MYLKNLEIMAPKIMDYVPVITSGRQVWHEMQWLKWQKLSRFSEKGTRGGISYISNRYSEANNKYLKSDYPKEESKHVIYT